MGTILSQAENRHSFRRSADPVIETVENEPRESITPVTEPLPEVSVQNDLSADQEFPIRRQMYFPFHTESSSNLPPPESWYNELQNSSQSQNYRDTSFRRGEDSDASLQIALTIVNELAELSAWLQRQSSALEASNHITFDPEGRPVFDVSIPISREPAEPVVPPSYSRATAGNTYLPSLQTNPSHPADFQRFLSRYSTSIDTSTPYGTPPPSYSRATSQQYINPSQRAVISGRQSPGVDMTPPPSYGRAVREHRGRSKVQTALDVQVQNTHSQRNSNDYVSNVTVE